MNVPFGLASALWLALAASPCGATEAWNDRGLDTPRLELVMRIVVTCTSPERPAPESASKDGRLPLPARPGIHHPAG
jgi:hypothetical protein